MGACMSSGPIEVSEEDKRLHREAEKQLKEAKAKMAHQVKVLLLGSGDSGKSTILKQMRLIHRVPFSTQEVESYRQLVFNNLTHGLKYLLDAMVDMELEVSEDNQQYIQLIEDAQDIRDGQPYPEEYLEPLRRLWEDPNVQKCWERGNEAALPDNLSYFFADLDRLFDPTYAPNEQDIVHTRARTIGITETVFHLRENEMLMVDVGGQKSERRKWIHCVTSILSGYDQCLINHLLRLRSLSLAPCPRAPCTHGLPPLARDGRFSCSSHAKTVRSGGDERGRRGCEDSPCDGETTVGGEAFTRIRRACARSFTLQAVRWGEGDVLGWEVYMTDEGKGNGRAARAFELNLHKSVRLYESGTVKRPLFRRLLEFRVW